MELVAPAIATAPLSLLGVSLSLMASFPLAERNSKTPGERISLPYEQTAAFQDRPLPA